MSDDPSDSPQVQFHLSPALAISGIIDYSTAEGRKHFDRAVARLNDELFNCEDDDLHAFIDALKERANEMGWNIPGVGITDVLLDPLNPDSEYVNILTNHGELTMEQIRDFESTYINLNTRAAQDTYTMYRCIINSITKPAIKKMSAWSNECAIDGRVSGNLAFKVLVRESGLDTKTTTTFIRNSLANLPDLMKKMGDDVLRFNTRVKGLIRSLRERGADSYDLLVNLNKGYMACQDKTFKKHINSVIERDEDDPNSDLTPDQLMVRAANKHKTLVQNGTWKAPDEVDKEILALKSELHKTKQLTSGKGPSHPAPNREQSKSGAGKYQTQHVPQKKWLARPKWLRNHLRPQDLDEPRYFAGVAFYYCCDDNNGYCKGRWAKHKPNNCWRREKNNKRKSNPNKPTSTPPSTNVSPSTTSQTASQHDPRAKKVKHAVAACVINAPEESEE